MKPIYRKLRLFWKCDRFVYPMKIKTCHITFRSHNMKIEKKMNTVKLNDCDTSASYQYPDNRMSIEHTLLFCLVCKIDFRLFNLLEKGNTYNSYISLFCTNNWQHNSFCDLTSLKSGFQ